MQQKLQKNEQNYEMAQNNVILGKISQSYQLLLCYYIEKIYCKKAPFLMSTSVIIATKTEKNSTKLWKWPKISKS